ncbi:hypothetical protein R0J89_19320, partial [Psychrobacter sp. SIMBA_152]
LGEYAADALEDYLSHGRGDLIAHLKSGNCQAVFLTAQGGYMTRSDFLANLATDATQTDRKVATTYSREEIAQLFDLPLMDLLLQ